MSNSQSASLAMKKSGFRSVGLRAIWTPKQIRALTNSSMRLSTDSPHDSSVEEAQVATERPSNGRRMFLFPRFSLAVLIGVGATLGWQSYGDEAREIIIEQIPTLGSLLAVSKMKSPAVATSPELAQQLIPLTFNLDVMRRSVDQLAAKQEQMAQSIAALQAVDEDVRQKVSSPPASPTQPAASVEQVNPPPQPKAQAVHPRSAPRPPAAGTGFVSR
jgi:hypothetical protein